MKTKGRALCLLLAILLLSGGLSACDVSDLRDLLSDDVPAAETADESGYLNVVEDEPDTVDFQCTSIHYTVAQNVFDRLVGMETAADGSAEICPELAESWDISPDRRCYTFRLREGVEFSNGAPLTAEDVRYSFERLLTHPDSCNGDIVDNIAGARELEEGRSDHLEGFQVLDKLRFSLTLEQPFEAFLACLSMPGASILDAETTEAAGGRFGLDPAWTVGTGSFILESWEPGKGMTLRANQNCWRGEPACQGLHLWFLTDPEEIRLRFENGELDLLSLDDIGKSAEFFLHGDIYRDRLYDARRISISYIALNESKTPLDDVRVRKALQLGLNRQVLLDAAYGGRGMLENGILPHGLSGYNPELPEIPYDPEEAGALLREAGWPNGFDLEIGVTSASTLSEMAVIRAAADMWEKLGVRVSIQVFPDSEFMTRRKSGELMCFSATWTADFNDPDNFLYTFFGNEENTRYRSLCYPREEIMERVRLARTIPEAEERIAEYRELERIIAQEDAAWIPLFTRLWTYVGSERLRGLTSSWNGSVKNEYRQMSVTEGGEGGK